MAGLVRLAEYDTEYFLDRITGFCCAFTRSMGNKKSLIMELLVLS